MWIFYNGSLLTRVARPARVLFAWSAVALIGPAISRKHVRPATNRVHAVSVTREFLSIFLVSPLSFPLFVLLTSAFAAHSVEMMSRS